MSGENETGLSREDVGALLARSGVRALSLSDATSETGVAPVIQPTGSGYWWAGPREAPRIREVVVGPSDGAYRFHMMGVSGSDPVTAIAEWLEPVTPIEDIAALRLGLAHAQEDMRTLRLPF